MIGVKANREDDAVIAEFFELFKTPWEFWQPEKKYDVLLIAGDSEIEENTNGLVLRYATSATTWDQWKRIPADIKGSGRYLNYKGTQFPIYGNVHTFAGNCAADLIDEETHRPLLLDGLQKGNRSISIGYDLFNEVRTLLTQGQPTSNAAIPTLEMHIALLRDLLVASGVRFIEIPPVPRGHSFIACLTHDIDHPRIRAYKWDHTIFGFVFRSTIGSLVEVICGRMSLRNVVLNWSTALRLPFVLSGFAPDFWEGFAERYSKIEEGIPSTYFVIPFMGYAGRTVEGKASPLRSSKYGANDIAREMHEIVSKGNEVGLHGLDAWLDPESSQKELNEIRAAGGTSVAGVRMHWLFFKEDSPAIMEAAGAEYDSTIGYRETVGFRSGTTQVFKPLSAKRLLELPLHVMDTALFYRAYLGLSHVGAIERLSRMLDDLEKFGGCFTINWHDRSLAPERNWEWSYREIVKSLRERGAWFATARQAAGWFNARRSIVFDCNDAESIRRLGCRIAEPEIDRPGMQLRVYNLQDSSELGTEEFANAQKASNGNAGFYRSHTY